MPQYLLHLREVCTEYCSRESRGSIEECIDRCVREMLMDEVV